MIRMIGRCLVLTVLAAVVVMTTSSLAAQVQAPAAAKPATPTKSTAAKWTPTKTPWGHPDLQGTWTSDSARGIPRERPEQFAGRTELTDAEYAERLARDEQTIKSALAASGAPTRGRGWG